MGAFIMQSVSKRPSIISGVGIDLSLTLRSVYSPGRSSVQVYLGRLK